MTPTQLHQLIDEVVARTTVMTTTATLEAITEKYVREMLAEKEVTERIRQHILAAIDGTFLALQRPTDPAAPAQPEP